MSSITFKVILDGKEPFHRAMDLKDLTTVKADLELLASVIAKDIEARK